MPVPSGLVRNSTSPGFAPAFDSTRAGIDRAGDGVAELDLLILHGVAAEQRRRRPRAACRSRRWKIARIVPARALPSETPAIAQRGQRPAAHRVDVADGVGGGDLAVDVRVVDDRREEIDGLHERRPALPPVYTRIVRGPEVDRGHGRRFARGCHSAPERARQRRVCSLNRRRRPSASDAWPLSPPFTCTTLNAELAEHADQTLSLRVPRVPLIVVLTAR